MKRRWNGEGGGASRPILLPEDEANRIAAGRKTQLRRAARNDTETGGLKTSALKPGLTYEVKNTTDQDALARITIISIEAQALVDITPDQARAEGFHDKFDRGRESDGIRARSLFADDWMTRHDRTWPLLEEQLCPKCEGKAYVDGVRCDGGCDIVGTMMVKATLGPEQILEVFRRRHAQRWVWVVTFELAQHLYLHRKTDGGYTADPREALLDAGEVLAPPSPDWARRAEVTRREALRSEHGARLAGLNTIEDRLVELVAMARDVGADIDDDLRAMERSRAQRLESIERKISGRTESEAA